MVTLLVLPLASVRSSSRRSARGRASCGVVVLAVSYLSVLISARPMLEREPAAMS